MAISLSRIKTVEKKIKSLFKSKTDTKLVIPNKWVDFAKKCKIRSGGNVVYFNPYDYQIELVNLMLKRSICCVKSRQLGISETITCFMLWRACLNEGYLGLVFSKNQVDSSLIARRMKRMIEGLGLKTATENLRDIEIMGGGRILFRNSNPDSARGIESVVDVFLDEFAFLENAKEVYDSLTPSQQMVGDDARVFMVSTPNGKNGFYWEILNNGNGEIDIELVCKKASDGTDKPFQTWIDDGGWNKVLIHWKTHPIYGTNPKFLEDINKKKKLSLATINQEYNLSFQDSDINYFSADIIRKCAIGHLENYNKDYFYFMGIDSATTGNDYAVCVILKYDNTCFSLVNCYRKREQSSEYHLYQMGELINEYRPTMVGVETTGGTGQVWLEELSKNHYGTQFRKIVTNQDTKVSMLDRLKLMLESEKFIFPKNSYLSDELLNFKRNGKILSAPNGKNDDVIMGVVFALTVAEIWGY